MVVFIVCTLIALGAFGAIFVIGKKRFVGQVLDGRKEAENKIAALDESLRSLPTRADLYASRKLIESIEQQTAEIENALQKDQTKLKTAEEKLDKAQKEVEEKETRHQEQKSAKDDEGERLEKLKEEHERLSAEAMNLEQRLSHSIKSLEQMAGEFTLTEDQKAAIDAFTKILEQSGARLRDLISEYDMINQRLVGLQEQHAELEEEYTRLVEKQLGAA